MQPDELWEVALGEIELQLSKANFNTWFKNTKILSVENGAVVIGVPNIFTKEWLEKKYNDSILKALQNISREITKISYKVYSPKDITPGRKTKLRTPASAQLKLSPSLLTKSGLNKKYSFESFVVGSFNELAYAAALAVAKRPGKKFNPLFIYGGVGLGKTHLLQAIGNFVLKKNQNKKVKYLTSEKFTSELISCIQSKNINSFKNKYRKIDVLIIDDIQFIAGKEKTQEEFFHTFNSLYEKEKQIIISSDRPPKDIPTLESRLRSRFEGGMTADIGIPDYETRMAILRKKVEEQDLMVTDEALDIIASKITRNIRELEGALNRIATLSEVCPEKLTKEKIIQEVFEFSSTASRMTTPQAIIETVCSFYDIQSQELLKKSRKKELAFPRQVIMYLMRTELSQSFPAIGRKLGGRDHTTVMYAFKKIQQEIKKNLSLKQEIDLIKNKIYNY